MADPPEPITVLALDGLHVVAAPRPSAFDRWFDCTIDVVAPPFSGTLQTVFTTEDLVDFATALDALAGSLPGAAVLGGGRAAELRLTVEPQRGKRVGALAVECSLTPSGDDPSPLLRFVVSGAAPAFLTSSSSRLREIAATDPWPTP